MQAILAVGSALLTAVTFYWFQSGGGTLALVLAIVFAIGTVVFGVMFLTGRINKTEDIHITE